MAGCAQRDSVPAKIELEDSNGTRIPPEQVDISLLGNLPNAERGALFALSQWCNGKLSSFLQLDLSQTNELVKILDGIPCFFAANQPEEAIRWSDGNLVGVSEYLPQKTGNRPLPVRQEKTQKDGPTMSDDEKQDAAQKFQSLQQDINFLREKTNQFRNQTFQLISQDQAEKFQVIVTELIRAKGITLLINSSTQQQILLHADQSFDITQEVIDAMNEKED